MSARSVSSRPDLDGLRLNESGTSDVWLVFGGERHRVTSPEVYDALFSGVDKLVTFEGVDEVVQGAELGEGTCLIRAEGGLGIHLLARAADGRVRRHHIPTFESFLDFGFDEARVREFPPLLIEGVEAGPELTSAADRAARG